MKGQIVADFIVQHRIDKQLDLDVGYVTFTPWKFAFFGIIVMSPSGAISASFDFCASHLTIHLI
jgi:hypothetical protein